MKTKHVAWMVKKFKDGKLAGQIFPIVNQASAEAIAARFETYGFSCLVSRIEY